MYNTETGHSQEAQMVEQTAVTKFPHVDLSSRVMTAEEINQKKLAKWGKELEGEL